MPPRPTVEGRPSRTARTVAIGRALGVGGIRDPLVADLLPRPDRAVVRAARTVLPRRPAVGVAAHAALRMHAMDRAVADAVDAVDAIDAAHAVDGGGMAMVVIIGAGFDTRAWRLPVLAGRRVVEVDRAATQATKRARLSALPAPVAILSFGAADLRTDDLEHVLDRAGHEPGAPVVWVWEAVVPYLPAAAVDVTLAELARRSPAGSRLLVSTMRPALVAPTLPALSIAARGLLAAVGEPIRTTESDEAFTARLARHGWAGSGGRGPRSWAAAAGITVRGPVVAERLHVATRRMVDETVSAAAGRG